MTDPQPHPWRFVRLGGFDQVRLETAEDFASLEHLEHLDPKLWAALACPAKGLEIDEQTLALVDTDGDGRIRVPEVIDAVKWAGARLTSLAALHEESDRIPLDRIGGDGADGQAVLAAARQILRGLGKADADAISLADVLDTATALAATDLNGDGVFPADAAGDEETGQVIGEIIDCLGPVADRSGKPGVDQASVDAFFKAAQAYLEWEARGASDPSLQPLGEGTAAAVDAWREVRAKVEDWFGRCRLAAFDPRALASLNGDADEFLAVSAGSLTVSADQVAGFPLARVEPAQPLDLVEGLNPAWAARVAAFRSAAVEPVFGAGKATLTAAEWAALGQQLGGHDAWRTSRPAAGPEKLGAERLREILASGAHDALTQLVADDRALEGEFQAIAQLERLVRYHRDLARILRNFLNFADFYMVERIATFQCGTLYLDGRSCDLCVRVRDAAKHAALAGLAKVYLAYCDCTRPTGEKMTIAAAFTDGGADYLMAGRNGVFYDRQGRDWDATITRVVENPISIRQAFWSPYKKLVRMIEEHAARRAAAAAAGADKQLTNIATTAIEADKAKPAEPGKVDLGTVAVLAVGVGALGTLLTALVGYATGFLELPFWKITLIMCSAFFLISTPSMVIAWLKLRQRNLAPILDANGWAINGRVRLTVRFGRRLTQIAALPPGARTISRDPVAERLSLWPWVLAAIVVLGFATSLLNDFGLVHRWTDGTWGTLSATEVQEASEAPR